MLSNYKPNIIKLNPLCVFPFGTAPHRPPFCCHPWGVVRSASHTLPLHSTHAPHRSQATRFGASVPFRCKECSAPLPRPHGRQQPIPTHPGGIGKFMIGRGAGSRLTTVVFLTSDEQHCGASHLTFEASTAEHLTAEHRTILTRKNPSDGLKTALFS